LTAAGSVARPSRSAAAPYVLLLLLLLVMVGMLR
jgi:hypothetical protein